MSNGNGVDVVGVSDQSVLATEERRVEVGETLGPVEEVRVKTLSGVRDASQMWGVTRPTGGFTVRPTQSFSRLFLSSGGMSRRVSLPNPLLMLSSRPIRPTSYRGIITELGGNEAATTVIETVFSMSMCRNSRFFSCNRTSTFFIPDRWRALCVVLGRLDDSMTSVLCLDAMSVDDDRAARVFDPDGNPLTVFYPVPSSSAS